MRINKYTTRLNKDKVCELVKEKGILYSEDDILNTPEKIVKMMNHIYDIENLPEEYVYLICLNTQMKPLGIFEISHGTLNCSVLSPREIFIKALLCNAYAIILIHNHPSGEVDPSREDNSTTKRVKEAGNIVGVSLIDHIIISDGTYYSFGEAGTL